VNAAAAPAWDHRARASAPEPARPATLEESRRRLLFALALFVIAVAAVLVRLVGIGFTAHSPGAARTVAAARGEIVDRNGVVLAQPYRAYALAIHPKKIIGDRTALAPQIAKLLGRPVDAVAADLAPDSNYRYLARRVTPALAQAVNALGEPAIVLEREPDRVYPNMALAAQVIGTVGRDGAGQTGIERAFEERLAAGESVRLSIDARVQQALENELLAGMTKHSAIAAAGVIMDVETGEVMALASLPALNPNQTARGDDPARVNHAVASVYELGSTFKPFTVAMALDSGATKLTDVYDASHPLKIGRFLIRDFRGKHRPLTVPEVLVYSSNIGTALMAERVGAERQREMMQRLGMLDRPLIELQERGRPLYPAQWSRIATMTVGYGHGIAVSPLHLATAYSALVNGGLWRPATLIRSDGAPPAGERVFSATTSATMRQLMRLVVLKGSGTKAEVPGYRIGGKTGTADKANVGGYNRHNRVATFAGVFPIDAPRYVVIAMLDSPQPTPDTYGFATAGWTSAPIVRKVVPRIAPMLGVEPDLTRDLDVSGLLPGTDKVEE